VTAANDHHLPQLQQLVAGARRLLSLLRDVDAVVQLAEQPLRLV
jgi:hypothetical protein